MEVRWTAHPARRRPQDVFLVAAVVLVSAWAVLVALENAFLAALAAVILLVAVAPFLLPTHYRVDDDGVEERRLWTRKRRAWADLRRLTVGPGGAMVSPFARKSWMDRYRGVVLLFDGLEPDGREQVVEALRAHVGAASGAEA